MYRLLIVDDEEIITDGLYEVFHRLMPEKLDICRAYSGKEALQWMERTRIDIVLTDIRMPGMSGLELSQEILTYWPRCRIVFLTGYSEFDYAYQAFQMPHVRYLLKTEGYSKVTETIAEVIREIDHSNQMSELVQQSQEQMDALTYMAQGDYLRHLLHESPTLAEHPESMERDFARCQLPLDPRTPVLLALGHLFFPAGTSYAAKQEMTAAVGVIWRQFLGSPTRSAGTTDKHGDMVWYIQPSIYAEEKVAQHMVRYLEGTLELVQEACMESLGLPSSFTISGAPSAWRDVREQHERLRQQQQMRIGDGISMIITDRTEAQDSGSVRDGGRVNQKVEQMAAHLEAGREEEFNQLFEEVAAKLQQPEALAQRSQEAYYAVALMLLSFINRWGLHTHVGDYGMLMRLEEHASLRKGVDYLALIAGRIFAVRRMDAKDRTAHVIERICNYIQDHLGDDLSLVRLAEIHYFNPSYLSRFFKQECGINLSDYIDQCRVRQAKQLLEQGELKVRDVAAAVGYEAAHSFTRFFKKTAGMTPQEYRDTLSSVGE
ncbi:helix-turn-helix domain-containing protein [Paenibacillus daejeonensis]|uniref:helix-turn-helix domain-containing protein n=1 Tax=Paenibacillus daejeonensis TaxID=135193 RepID=UPI0003818958|nr:helix-turn-helix domain-containing protein [Paenibacillus daejeonensis]